MPERKPLTDDVYELLRDLRRVRTLPLDCEERKEWLARKSDIMRRLDSCENPSRTGL